MLNSSSSTGVTSLRSFGNGTPRSPTYRNASPLFLGAGKNVRGSRSEPPVAMTSPTVDITSDHAVRRRGIEWSGMGVEFVQATTHHRADYRFRSPLHLLAAYDNIRPWLALNT